MAVYTITSRSRLVIIKAILLKVRTSMPVETLSTTTSTSLTISWALCHPRPPDQTQPHPVVLIIGRAPPLLRIVEVAFSISILRRQVQATKPNNPQIQISPTEPFSSSSIEFITTMKFSNSSPINRQVSVVSPPSPSSTMALGRRGRHSQHPMVTGSRIARSF